MKNKFIQLTEIMMNVKIAMFLVVFLMISNQTTGQSFWVNQNSNVSTVSLEWTKPFFDDGGLDDNDKISFFTTSGFLSGKYKINGKLSLFADFPFSHWEFKDGDGVDVQDPHTTLGNIYIGGIYNIPFKIHSINSSIEFGGRIPTMPEPDFPDKRGGFTGFVAEPERRESFTYKTTAVQAFYEIEYAYNSDMSINAGLGVSYWTNPENQFYDKRVDIAQKVNATFKLNKYTLGMGFTGKYHTKGNDPFFENYNTTQVSTEFGRQFDSIKTIFFVQAPLQDTFYDFGIGFTLTNYLNTAIK